MSFFSAINRLLSFSFCFINILTNAHINERKCLYDYLKCMKNAHFLSLRNKISALQHVMLPVRL